MATLQKEQPITATQSATLVRNLFRASIYSIAFNRKLFPEECFVEKTIGGLTVKSLTPANEDAHKLIAWLEEGVFDALEKKYLKSVTFAIAVHGSTGDREIIEQYTFHITYPDDGSDDCRMSLTHDGGTLSFSSKDEIRESTLQLLRSLIIVAESLPPLPPERFYIMQLQYYDDRTPAEYEPTHFAPAQNQPLAQPGAQTEATIGEVSTTYHRVTMDVHMPTLSSNSLGGEQQAKRPRIQEEKDDDDTETPRKGESETDEQKEKRIFREAEEWVLKRQYVQRKDIGEYFWISEPLLARVMKPPRPRGHQALWDQRI
ncbi:hypothetical protein PAPYR_1298 [Paratrimastix pyriformis]|uniref:HORMA domain-containing protein n=1 Tax=Paratrimastix pyriformis TaxID=342808 RepID=A0ABQ8USM5_9EUKA|nr:hypothetical protein PAPYR_1298 [Paratrimastix pyriformis]